MEQSNTQEFAITYKFHFLFLCVSHPNIQDEACDEVCTAGSEINCFGAMYLSSDP